MRTTVELNNEIARHRKLLNRAVGDKILTRINCHHYEIVQLITELEEVERNTIIDNIIGLDPRFTGLKDMLAEQFLKAEDKFIMTGEFNDINTEFQKKQLLERQSALNHTKDILNKTFKKKDD